MFYLFQLGLRRLWLDLLLDCMYLLENSRNQQDKLESLVRKTGNNCLVKKLLSCNMGNFLLLLYVKRCFLAMLFC